MFSAPRFIPAAVVALASLLAGILVLVASSPAQDEPTSDRPVGDHGLFRVECDGAPGINDGPLVVSRPIDPIVSSGVPAPNSHLHDFVGSFGVSEDATNDSVRGYLSTCLRADEKRAHKVPADRSLMWVPAAYQDGHKVGFTDFDVTYRTARRDPSSIEPFPSGLKVIAGTSTPLAPGDPPRVKNVFRWYCIGSAELAPGSQSTAPTCMAPGLAVSIRFPDCWDGHSEDSADHKSHMVYAVRNPARIPERVCPEDHPVAVPNVEFLIRYPTTGGPGFRLASITDPSGQVDTSTTHADYMFGWDDAEFAHLVDACLRADRYCGTSRFPRNP